MRESFYDQNLLLKDAGLVATSAAATVSSAAKTLNLGAGLVEGYLYVDVTAIEIASNDELYKIALQGSDNADFSTGDEEDLAIIEIGAAEVLGGDQDSAVGRYVIPFRTERNGVIYPHTRIYTTVSGTVATGINFTAWLGT